MRVQQQPGRRSVGAAQHEHANGVAERSASAAGNDRRVNAARSAGAALGPPAWLNGVRVQQPMRGRQGESDQANRLTFDQLIGACAMPAKCPFSARSCSRLFLPEARARSSAARDRAFTAARRLTTLPASGVEARKLLGRAATRSVVVASSVSFARQLEHLEHGFRRDAPPEGQAPDLVGSRQSLAVFPA